jgi:hypothetical protein
MVGGMTSFTEGQAEGGYYLFLFGTQTPSVPPCFGNWQ